MKNMILAALMLVSFNASANTPFEDQTIETGWHSPITSTTFYSLWASAGGCKEVREAQVQIATLVATDGAETSAVATNALNAFRKFNAERNLSTDGLTELQLAQIALANLNQEQAGN